MELKDKYFIMHNVIREYVSHYMNDCQECIDDAFNSQDNRYDDNYIHYYMGKVDALLDVLDIIMGLTPLSTDDIIGHSELPEEDTFDVYGDNNLVTMSFDTFKKMVNDPEFSEDLIPTITKIEIEMDAERAKRQWPYAAERFAGMKRRIS